MITRASILITLCLGFSIIALAGGKEFGESFKAKKSVSVAKMQQKVLAKGTWTGVVSGTVKEVCKAEGCWLRLDDGSKSGILVKMKDHKFLLPKDIDGRSVVIKGTAFKKTTSVEELRHYAVDAGKTSEEIAKITEPKVEIRMDATGVVLLP